MENFELLHSGSDEKSRKSSQYARRKRKQAQNIIAKNLDDQNGLEGK
jgi:hypothetical protein